VSAFKNWIDRKLLTRMGEAIGDVYPTFDRKRLLAIAPKLKSLELKARVRLVRDCLHELLPSQASAAIDVLLKSTRGGLLDGFDLWPYTEFIQTYGLNEPQKSLDALKELTVRFTGEFAVRPFLLRHPEITLAYLDRCTTSPNVHVRRWVSEGSRPRLPWGERLGPFIANPDPGLRLLEKLKYDSELYVRKSVANHLNDVSKDHPNRVLTLLAGWNKTVPPIHRSKIAWVTRHALRTLIKNGNVNALALIGVRAEAAVKVAELRLNKKTFELGEVLEFSFNLRSQAKIPQKLVIDYAVHHVKANGKTSPKVFKLKTFVIDPQESRELRKKHAIKAITTRRYYPGAHKIDLIINGQVRGEVRWNLVGRT